ncbi:hypothetical protein CFP56_013396 [Quercus suber]|uniref:Uncharacterized protein n=1 Tax=Quercus suber TaxID=58331 RepID=A0AAW0KUF7_QUESU
MEQQNLNPDFPKQLSIASLFLAYNSDTETDDSSESNEIPPKLALYSNFIMSFYLARSQSDSSSSENYEIIPTDPLLSKSPTCIIRKDSFEFLMRKSSSSALSNGIPRIFSHSKKRKIHTVILFSSQVSVSSQNDEIIQIRPTRHNPSNKLQRLDGNCGWERIFIENASSLKPPKTSQKITRLERII